MAYPYPLAPVEAIELYRSDVRVVRSGQPPLNVPKTRSEITHFSRKARARLAFVANNTPVDLAVMMTLTYPAVFPGDGQTVKRHLNKLLIYLKRRYPGLSYLWFFEFQERGAPHVHILTTRIPVNRDSYAWLSETWYRICESGDTKHLRAGTRLERRRSEEGLRRYTVKYATKMKQKVVPPGFRNVGRFWGCSRDVPPQPCAVLRCTEDDLVGALQAIGWRYQRDDKVRWSVLYNVSVDLTAYLTPLIMEHSSIGPQTRNHTETERRNRDATAFSHDGRRLRSSNRA